MRAAISDGWVQLIPTAMVCGKRATAEAQSRRSSPWATCFSSLQVKANQAARSG